MVLLLNMESILLVRTIHLIKVDVESTFEPIIGTEVQSKELIDSLMKGQEDNPNNIWKSELFGRSLEEVFCVKL